jgi:hypothetical protein
MVDLNEADVNSAVPWTTARDSGKGLQDLLVEFGTVGSVVRWRYEWLGWWGIGGLMLLTCGLRMLSSTFLGGW